MLTLLERHAVPSISYFICGLSEDNPKTVSDTIIYLSGLPTRIGISLFYAVPGLPDFSDKSRFDTLSPKLCAGSSAYPWNGSLPTQTMITAFRLSRLCNHLKQVNKTNPLINRIWREKRLTRCNHTRGSLWQNAGGEN